MFLKHYQSSNGSSGEELWKNSYKIRYYRRCFKQEIFTKVYVSFKEQSVNTNWSRGLIEGLTKLTWVRFSRIEYQFHQLVEVIWGFCPYYTTVSAYWLYNSQPQRLVLAWSFRSMVVESLNMNHAPSSKCSDLRGNQNQAAGTIRFLQ